MALSFSACCAKAIRPEELSKRPRRKIHVTAGVELWGPGGWYVDQEFRDALVSDASQRIAKLEQDSSIKADVFIGSGDVPKILRQAAIHTNADLLVTGCYPYGGNVLRHGFQF